MLCNSQRSGPVLACPCPRRSRLVGAVGLVLTVLANGCSWLNEGADMKNALGPPVSAFIVDERATVTQLAGLTPGLQTVDFDIYLSSNKPAEDWADMVANPGKYFNVGTVGVGVLAPPAVVLAPIPGFPLGRRVSVSFLAATEGVYVLHLGNIFTWDLPAGGIGLNDVKDGQSWPKSRTTGDRGFAPLIRVVGACRYATVVRVNQTEPGPKGWRIEFSEPLPGGTLPVVPVNNWMFPKNADIAAPAPNHVTATAVADSPREVFVAAPEFAFNEQGSGVGIAAGSMGPWILPAALGMANPFVPPYSCAPKDAVITLRRDPNAVIYNVHRTADLLEVLWPQPGAKEKAAK